MVCVPVLRDNPRASVKGLSTIVGTQMMLHLTCTMISSVALAHNEISHAKDWVSVDCGTSTRFSTISEMISKDVKSQVRALSGRTKRSLRFLQFKHPAFILPKPSLRVPMLSLTCIFCYLTSQACMFACMYGEIYEIKFL